MSIDLSILYGGTSSTGTMSALAMYKKLEKQADENASAEAEEAEAEKVQAQIREMNNAAIRVRNAQYKQGNAEVANDVTYFKNRAASATTVDELINDDRVLKVIAYANDMGDLYNTDRQRLRDILTSDLNDVNSVARQGSAKELELAKKYNFGATGTQTDTDGNTIGIDANGDLVNDGSGTTDLPAGLAKLKALAVDANGKALLDSTGALISGSNVVSSDASAYSKALTKTLLSEETATESTEVAYAYDGDEFERFKTRTDIQSEVDYYKNNIGSVESVDDLFANQRLLNFILKAYDMESEAQYPGKIRKILESDLADSDSLANRFQDPRYQQMAEDFSFYIFGTSRLTSSGTIDDVVEKFQQTEYEKYLDEQAPGVRVAIEFKRRLDDVDTTLQLLGDSVLREVITVANYIPDEMAYQEVEAQVTTVEKKVDIDALKSDPELVEKMVQRYLSIKDGEASSGGADSYLLDLFA